MVFDNNEKGSVFVMVLLLLSICSSLGIALNILSGLEMKSTLLKQDLITAEYIAESGAKAGIQEVLDYLSNNEDAEKCKQAEVNKAISEGCQYTLSYSPVLNATSPLEVERISINSIVNYKKVSATAKVDVILDSRYIAKMYPPNIIDLMRGQKDIDGGSENAWGVKANKGYGKAGEDEKVFWLFNDRLSKDKFRIDYNLKLTNIQNAEKDVGCGVVYGVPTNATADNFRGYIAGYDEGGNSFAVTKFFEKDYLDNNPEDITIATEIAGHPQGQTYLPEYDIFHPFLQSNGIDPLGNDRGTCILAFDELVEKMNQYYEALRQAGEKLPDGREVPERFMSTAEGDELDLYQEHTISVEMKEEKRQVNYGEVYYQNDDEMYKQINPVGSAINKTSYETRKVHIVYIDGCELLKFVDFEDVVTHKSLLSNSQINYSLRKIDLSQNTRSGLRLWNADTEFNNNPDLSFGQTAINPAGIYWYR